MLLLCGCDFKKQTNSNDDKYLNLIETLNDRTIFAENSEYFNITTDVAKTNDAYRYYVIIDNPKNAMYDVEIVAVEKGVNYTLNMAANIGVFEETSYNLIPGQSYPDKGYVSGLSISGVSSSANPTLYLVVQWYSNKQEIHQEFYQLNVSSEGE